MDRCGLGTLLFEARAKEDIVLLKDGYIGGFTGYRNTNQVAVIPHGETRIGWCCETRNHQGIAFAHMRIGDMDNDGYDEVCTGRVCIDHNGQAVLMRLQDPIWANNPLASYTTLQLADLFPERPGLEAFTAITSSGDTVFIPLPMARTVSIESTRVLPMSILPALEMWI